MTTRSLLTRTTALGLVVSMALALFGALLAAPAAAAQAVAPTLAVSSHVLDDSGQFTAVITLDPGDAQLGALSAHLAYNQDALAVESCSMGELGVCNAGPERLSFAAIAPTGFAVDPSFVVIDFRVIVPGMGSDLALTVETAADVIGNSIDGVFASSGVVTPAAAGGINGEALELSGAGLFGMQVCAISTSGNATCTVTTGLGAFVIDGLANGDYSLIVSDPNEILATESLVVTVVGSEVTTGIEVTLAPPGTAETPPASLTVPAPEEPVELVTVEAGPQEIVVQVTAASGGFPVFGTNVCATMPLIGTQACGFTDADGVARLADLAIGNYELTATDPAGRFGAAEPIFVGLNPNEGIVASLVLPAVGLGEPPELLAFVDQGAGASEGTGVIATILALAALTGVAATNRNRD